MKRIKDGWLVEPLPVFFDSEDAAWNFAAWCSVDDDGRLYRAEGKARPLGELTDEDFAC